jgi:hypothetical protein
MCKIQGAKDMKASYFEEKESLLAGITPNPNASDEMLKALHERLKEYERALCLIDEGRM